MVLKVPLDNLQETMSHLGIAGPVFVSGIGGRSLVSIADPARSILLHAESRETPEAVRSWLEERSIAALTGCWSHDGAEEILPSTSFWIIAIAYRSDDEKPGLWVDTVTYKPSPGEALSKMFEEFRSSGELDGMTLDDFIERADPNVVILDPEDQARFAADSPCP